MIDVLGNGLKLIIGPGHKSDIWQAESLIKGIRNSAVMADKGYDSDPFRATLKKQDCELAGKSNRVVPIEYDKNNILDLLLRQTQQKNNLLLALKHNRN